MFVLEECKNGLVINTETIQITAVKGAVFLMILRQNFKANNVWPVRFTHHKGFTDHLRAALAQKLSIDYFGKLIKFQCQTVILYPNHDYFLRKRGVPVETQSSLIL
jgi:hypothetical protein